MLYRYCSDRGIPHKQLGKLIVATSVAEIPKLENLMRFGIANGVEDLRMMEGFEAMKIEPELQCVKALLSPSTGIVDSHSFMLSLLVGPASYQLEFFLLNVTLFFLEICVVSVSKWLINCSS